MDSFLCRRIVVDVFIIKTIRVTNKVDRRQSVEKYHFTTMNEKTEDENEMGYVWRKRRERKIEGIIVRSDHGKAISGFKHNCLI